MVRKDRNCGKRQKWWGKKEKRCEETEKVGRNRICLEEAENVGIDRKSGGKKIKQG